MKFLNEQVRKEFHLLSVEKQKALTDCDERFLAKGLELNILYVDKDEVSLRIDERNHISPAVELNNPSREE